MCPLRAFSDRQEIGNDPNANLRIPGIQRPDLQALDFLNYPAMSSGFSATDFLTVGRSCWKTYKRCKNSTGAYAELSCEVSGLFARDCGSFETVIILHF